jgi:hypothetical protein
MKAVTRNLYIFEELLHRKREDRRLKELEIGAHSELVQFSD